MRLSVLSLAPRPGTNLALCVTTLIVAILVLGCTQGSKGKGAGSPEGAEATTGGDAAEAPGAEEKGLDEKGMGYGADAKKVYDRGMRGFNAGGCEYAEGDFNEVRRKFPYSRYAALSELRIADCQLKRGEYVLAIQSYRQFIRNRPSHPEVSHAHFQVAQAYAEQIPPDLFFMPPAHELDPKPAREALRQARRFVADYSTHEKVPEAEKIIKRSLQVLAGHELYAARFYRKRKAHQGVVARITTMMVTYPDNPYQAEGLLLLGEAHIALKDKPKAREALTELVERLPESDEATKGRTLLERLGASASTSPEGT